MAEHRVPSLNPNLLHLAALRLMMMKMILTISK
jgi:hypothetical protein